MQVYQDIVIGAEPIYRPKYNIGPYCKSTAKVSSNQNYIEFFNLLFPNKTVTLTRSGKHAIQLALADLKFSKDDEVAILTTSGNKYISGCVTKEIDKVCKWSREITTSTKAIFVNHEFGFPYEDLTALKVEYGLPIIEDVAHGLFSQNSEKSVGTVGDYVVCSLPKIFPIQMGGALLHDSSTSFSNSINKITEKYLTQFFPQDNSEIDLLIEKRQDNYNYLTNRITEIGGHSFFELKPNINPGVFMFGISGFDNWDNLKLHMQSNGVESSVFYGESAFFIPVHQNLDRADLDYFYRLIDYFINEN